MLANSKVLFSVLEIQKDLIKVSKLKECEGLKDWIKPCINHLFWSALSTYDGNGRVIVAKFKSFLSHMVNKHTNLEDPLFSKCAHGDDIKNKKWLKAGNDDAFFANYFTKFGHTYLQRCVFLGLL